MKIHILQHTSNEGPGTIRDWAHAHGHELYIYHPNDFGILPQADTIDLLVILGGPMSPNDEYPWIVKERALIQELMDRHIPILGVCFGGQQIAKTLGASVHPALHKEVGWAPIYSETEAIPGLPKKMTVLHVHQDMFEIPKGAVSLFHSDLNPNQGFMVNSNIAGLQFHFEPDDDAVREIMLNAGDYALDHNDLHQTPEEIMKRGVPKENKEIMFKILDFITKK